MGIFGGAMLGAGVGAAAGWIGNPGTDTSAIAKGAFIGAAAGGIGGYGLSKALPYANKGMAAATRGAKAGIAKGKGFKKKLGANKTRAAHKEAIAKAHTVVRSKHAKLQNMVKGNQSRANMKKAGNAVREAELRREVNTIASGSAPGVSKPMQTSPTFGNYSYPKQIVGKRYMPGPYSATTQTPTVGMGLDDIYNRPMSSPVAPKRNQFFGENMVGQYQPNRPIPRPAGAARKGSRTGIFAGPSMFG